MKKQRSVFRAARLTNVKVVQQIDKTMRRIDNLKAKLGQLIILRDQLDAVPTTTATEVK